MLKNSRLNIFFIIVTTITAVSAGGDKLPTLKIMQAALPVATVSNSSSKCIACDRIDDCSCPPTDPVEESLENIIVNGENKIKKCCRPSIVFTQLFDIEEPKNFAPRDLNKNKIIRLF